jgi:hypothetical protein
MEEKEKEDAIRRRKRLSESESLNDSASQMHDELQHEEEGGRSDIGKIPKTRSFTTFKRDFHMADSCDFAVNAMKVRPNCPNWSL